MNLLKTFQLSWWQTGLFKVCLISLGLAAGSTWPAVFAPYLIPLLVVFVATSIYISYVWWRQ